MMRAGDALLAMRALPVLAFEAAFADQSFAVLAPHPDDESLGCGGVIAEACSRGSPPAVVILTDGTGSHPNSRQYPPERLRALREGEALAATACLGVPARQVHFLGFRDTEAPKDGAALDEAAGRLAGILQAARCRTLLAPWRHDPHGDHVAAAAIAAKTRAMLGLRLLAYPVWGLALAAETVIDATAVRGFRVTVAHHLQRKRCAIHAHASQYAGIITDDPQGFQMEPDFIGLFLQDTEIFMDVTEDSAVLAK